MENSGLAKVGEYLTELNYRIVKFDKEEGVYVVEKEEDGITNLFLGVAAPILIIEQYLFTLKEDNIEVFKSLLQKNRDIIHGAFALDEEGDKVIFRDTLQVENLDLNELEGSLNSLSLLLSEYSDELIKFSKN
ncbi:MAG: YbjN domain-containing protein [Ichthyobacteriaceae bacterium]|nr:YbjN domain-containing protein [Ichthyobacteriaceae bacterium]